MSHEIRTPMNAIVGFSEMLGEEELTEQQRKYVEPIKEASENLLQLINDILDFSKIEAGKLDIETVDCSLDKLLFSVESLMEQAATEKGLEFKIIRSDPLPAQIRTDPVRVRQCLFNLVSNAIKFTKEGHVYVKVSLEQENDQSYIHFDVEDTGIGIPPSKQRVIFEAFSQADGSTTRKYGGTGLGLAITRQLSDLLGGELTLRSEVGKGSVFTLIIPVGVDAQSQPLLGQEVPTARTSESATAEGPNRFYGRVLVAEDSRTNQTLIRVLLRKLGLRVTIVEDGREAVEAATHEPYDLIFMDIQMPNMNGYEATRILRTKRITTPIVALTANAMKGDSEKCISAGCDEYLTKPINRKKLLEIIRRYLKPRNEDIAEKIDSLTLEVDSNDEIESQKMNQEFRKKLKQTAEMMRAINEKQIARAESDDKQEFEVVIDWSAAVETCGDEVVIRTLARAMEKDGRQTMEMLQAAVAARNAAEIQLHAHKLKGATMTIGARRVSETAHRLEWAGKEEDMEVIDALFEQLQVEFDKLMALLSLEDWVERAKKQAECSRAAR